MGVYRINKHKFPLCNLKDFEEHLHLNLFLGTIFGNLIRGFFSFKKHKINAIILFDVTISIRMSKLLKKNIFLTKKYIGL
jgi:hypothetical protein